MTGFGGLDERPDIIEAEERAREAPRTTAEAYQSIADADGGLLPAGMPDGTVERLARVLAGIYGRGRDWEGILSGEQAAYRNDARVIINHLRGAP